MDLYRKIGIDPPRGVLLYGPPGKLAVPVGLIELTMCRDWKDNAGQGSRKCYQGIFHPSRWIRVCAEVPRRGMSFFLTPRVVLIKKGPRMVRDVFRLARENSPCIIFIDEVDAIATKRFDAQTGSDREVQRILLELLNQMDGFDQQTSVKVS
jgi:26S proteasome regulatory subunit T3